jgi:hypothetical protein
MGCWGDGVHWYELDALESYWEISFVYGLKVLFGGQRILDPKCAQILEEKRSQKK